MSQQINLFNPIFLKQKKYFSALTMVQALGMISMGAVLLTGYAKYQLSSLNQEADAASAQLAAVQTRLAKVTVDYAPKQKSKDLEAQVKKLEAEVRALQGIFTVLEKGDFGSTTGYAEYMRAFSRQIINGVWLTGFSIDGAGSGISVQGRAVKPELVPAYITRLRDESVLKGKSFAAFEMQLPPTESVKQEPRKDQKEPKEQPRALSYVDFRLQSSSMIKESEPLGGKAK